VLAITKKRNTTVDHLCRTESSATSAFVFTVWVVVRAAGNVGFWPLADIDRCGAHVRF